VEPQQPAAKPKPAVPKPKPTATKPATKPPRAKPKPPAVIPKPVVTKAKPVALDAGERGLLQALRGDDPQFKPAGTTRLDADRAQRLLAAAHGLRKGFRVSFLGIERGSADTFIAHVDDAWREAVAFSGPLGAPVRDTTWTVVRDVLNKQAGALRQSPALRTPAQKAQARRDFLRMLARVEDITHRLSACPDGDPLRQSVTRFHQDQIEQKALLGAWTTQDRSLEKKIPWLGKLFAEGRAKHGLK
jgi:hypothetical protein